MTTDMRVADDLNRALHGLFAADERAYLLGEDVLDPYGGAFTITRGLSTAYPERVLTTPISEGAIAGAAAGLALAGNTAVAEMMFGDFVTLAFDQIVNFAAKSVSMYGERLPLRLIVRCPTGGNRGYGPTHSQSLQKHFIGVPDLALFEISPLHPSATVLRVMRDLAQPCMLFEDKVLYTRPVRHGGRIDDVFRVETTGPAPGTAVVSADTGPPDCVLIAPGGLVERALEAMRTLLFTDDVACRLVVPAQLYPPAIEPLVEQAAAARSVCVLEDSTAGGTWGAHLAHEIHRAAWGRLRRPVRLVHAADRVVPAAPHLERAVLVQAADIRRAVLEEINA
ncbi:transketolase C-terminal domain-containing protein [Micromonospora sp. DT43]|uniref:transketolase C-terminal domain-containing protein n=1 Tax=Micromonospora sp. DT43 TaxID=3393440 RepID=UPI003CFA07C3